MGTLILVQYLVEHGTKKKKISVGKTPQEVVDYLRSVLARQRRNR